jgi:diketogulonate reductase-like aldo/keto reductase
MKRRPFGPLALDIPVVGQGTWNLERIPERQAIDALVAGMDAGMTHIDTAELYGSGRVERIVGKAIRGRRGDVFLVSKVLPSNASFSGTIAACERSLSQLGTDYLDVYLLHWTGSFPLAETIRAFEALRAAGKIRGYGVSNFDVDDLEEAHAIAGDRHIVCNQVLYHLKERSIERQVVPWCAAHDVAVVAYSPFGSGNFPSLASASGRVLSDVAAARGASPYQVALAFLMQQSNAFVIPKAATVEHALENAAAGRLLLERDEMAALGSAFPAKKRRGLAMI